MLDTAGGSTSAPDGETAIPVSPSPTSLNVPCPCPGKPHPYDTVTFRAHASLPMGQAASTITRLYADDEPVMQGELARLILRYGIESWTFTDKDGRPVEISEPIPALLIERWLSWGRGGAGLAAGEVANRLYGKEIFDPLVERSLTLSQRGAGPNSISPTNDSGTTPPTPSEPSSPTRLAAGKRSVVRAL